MRLISSTGQISGPYAALSYCWGPNPTFLCLTSLNQTELEGGTSYRDLLVAFQEAIDILRGLSIQYLWIDALCIIQSGPGSMEDWRTKSVKMQDVYSNSIITLSLSRASHSGESCLGECDLACVTKPFTTEMTNLWQSDEPVSSIVIPYDYYERTLYDQPLAHRAWAFQERLLAPCDLSLGLGGLFWDCAQNPNASEYLPYGFRDLAETVEVANEFDLTDKGIPDTLDKKELIAFWCHVLEEYTARELTFPERDRLVTLSAISTRMETALDDVYLAGHFWTTLPASLNWRLNLEGRNTAHKRITPPRKENPDERHNVIPSWRWASIDGGISCSSCKDQSSLADAVSYEMIHGRDVSVLSLTIRAYCAEMQWVGDTPVILGNSKTWNEEKYTLRVRMDDTKDQLDDGTICWMLALDRIDWLKTCMCIVLREVPTKQEKWLCQRIGHFTLSSDVRDSWSEDFAIAFGQEKSIVTLI